MRGARSPACCFLRVSGIIPAYAGSTWRSRRVGSLTRDHPRMRGALGTARRLQESGGIIPAYAGSTTMTRTECPACQDHPRVCGEHVDNGLVDFPCEGSSPRMRGAPIGRNRLDGEPGIIPAYAGSTRLRLDCRVAVGDHPRVCGEHGTSFTRFANVRGSSPRMRGARVRVQDPHRTGGIIPAYAGSTCR